MEENDTRFASSSHRTTNRNTIPVHSVPVYLSISVYRSLFYLNMVCISSQMYLYIHISSRAYRMKCTGFASNGVAQGFQPLLPAPQDIHKPPTSRANVMFCGFMYNQPTHARSEAIRARGSGSTQSAQHEHDKSISLQTHWCHGRCTFHWQTRTQRSTCARD